MTATLDFPRAIERPTPTEPSRGGTTSGDGHTMYETHSRLAVAGADHPTDHGPDATQKEFVGGVQAGTDQPAANIKPTPKGGTSLADPFLGLAADILDDAEANRRANENRLRQLTRTGEDSDGEDRGFGLDLSHPAVAQLAGLVQMMKCDSNVTVGLGMPKPRKERGKPCCFEHTAETNLSKMLRKHPLGPWVKAQKGIGDKQAARLLAVVGDPYVNDNTGEIRTVSQLWAYCGHGDPARKPFKGMSQADMFRLGNPVAKSRVWLIACAVLKSGGGEEKAIAAAETKGWSPSLAATYYHRKHATEGKLHTADCKRCGPSGKPAQPGSPWSDAHRHADALRILGKEILRGMWLEAKRIHELSDDGQTRYDTQRPLAVAGDQTAAPSTYPT